MPIVLEMTEDGELKTINVQDMGAKKNAFVFLSLMNGLDVFVHEIPIWKNKIWTAVSYQNISDYSNSSSATA